MSEQETQQSETRPTPAEMSVDNGPKARSGWKGVVIAVVVVSLMILGVLYLLEKEGRSSTTIFSDLIERQQASAVVAVVNGQDITNAKLQTSIEQFIQVALAQGVDTADPEVQGTIREQALQVLINTELLKQEAADRGIDVTDEQVSTRLEEIETELGGEAALAERMTALGIEPAQLQKDIKDEMIIRSLLDQVFDAASIIVSEEEITAVYENAGGEAAGLPALAEVREQVEAQIIASKEQEAVDGFINELKAAAAIEIVSAE